MKRNRWSRGVLAIAAGATLTGSLMVPASGADAVPAGDGGAAFTPSSSGRSTEVTLITGHVVHWNTDGGRRFATVEDNGDHSTFQTIEDGDSYYVIPSEVSPLIGTYLDKELFNISGLVKQGYTDDAVQGTPVIVQGSSGGAAQRTPSTPPGLTKERALRSINAVAGTVKEKDTKTFGKALVAAASDKVKASAAKTNHTFTASALPGVQKIWLDKKVHVDLEESVPQTGAPEAWKAGYDGTGTTVAVLDTGIDESHPDLAGRIVESDNFTPEDSVADGNGHGTHVASTVAGSGAASDGLRKGVAPGTKLAIGKVLDSKGSGTSSGVLAGMEWAANLPDVDVISMSLGGSASDGNDPMSQAVNTLTKEKGKLFVIAAGNEGPGAGTVNYPGAADEALTVGAVDKAHALAYFSSRGPRIGNYGIKPEITAPGVGIKAARAKGTSMGDPVDENYTSANGTSMATPHVAGAVAILKQEHPNWDPATLKSALIGSATPKAGLSVFEQGGGELNVAQASQVSVLSTPSTLSMGSHQFPHAGAQPVTRKLTYTNKGTADATVELKVEGLADAKGTAAPEGMVTVSPSTVTLAPGASTEVEVTLDRSLGDNGRFSGTIAASDADGKRVSGTPIGFNKDPELHTLTVKGTQPDGMPADGYWSPVSVMDVNDRTTFNRSISYVDGVATVRVPPGTYSVMTTITTEDEGGRNWLSQAMMGKPEVRITEDTELTFDARQAKPITVGTAYPNAKVESHAFQFNRADAKGRNYTVSFVGGTWPLYVSPTDPVSLGSFNFASKFEMSAPGAWMDLNYPEPGRIPADPAYTVDERTLATVNSQYHSDNPGEKYMRAHTAVNSWETIGAAGYHYLTAPQRRVEHYSGGDATTWRQSIVRPSATSPVPVILNEPSTRYRAGDHLTQSWFAGPRTPSLNAGNAVTPADLPNRNGNLMSVKIYEWGDANTGSQIHYGSRNADYDTSAFVIYKDDVPYAKGDRAFGSVEVPNGRSRYRFELDSAREGQDWWTTSTRTRTAWEFDSDTTDAAMPLPLLQIGYDMDLDLTNTTRAPKDAKGPFVIGLDVRQPRTAKATTVTSVKAWLSYDDGKTWTAQSVKANEPGRGTSPFEVRGAERTGGGFASLKVKATDDAGNTVTQEVIRAYKLHP